jgi:hypothetical protein
LHTLTIRVSDPNGVADEDASNNIKALTIQFLEPVTTVKESFEGAQFPPPGWDILNPDGAITWEKAIGIAKTGTASAKLNNYDYDQIGAEDDLRLPGISIPVTSDSAFLSFEVAAAVFSPVTTPNNQWDTLQVLVSTDCGKTFVPLYKKWGANLVTRAGSVNNPYIPSSSEWRRDSINLGDYIGQQNLLIAFRNTTGFENNIYLDDINLRTVEVNPNLKREGFLITPNPTRDLVVVQFYPQPTDLKGIYLYNDVGQLLNQYEFATSGGSYYTFNLGRYAAGTYFVKVVFADRVYTRRIIRL